MNFSVNEIERLVLEKYGLTVMAKALNGYDELNFILTEPSGKKYIFKIATDDHVYEFLDAQVKIVNHLSASPVSGKFQHYIKNSEGNELTTLIVNNKNYYLRMLSFLEGAFWVDATNHSDTLMHSLGKVLGEMQMPG